MRIILTVILIFACGISDSQHKFKFVEGTDLYLAGKLVSHTTNPYNRVDTLKYKGFTAVEKNLVSMSSGLCVAFRTNSTTISVKTQYGKFWSSTNCNAIAGMGYDLYIRVGNEWKYAASGVLPEQKSNRNLVLLRNMDTSEKECLLYLPIYSEIYSVKIGVDINAEISPLTDTFRHRICVYGSSFTQGRCATRSGMAWPSQLSRSTGLQMLNLGCSGNCTMQPCFADIIADSDADAFLFDTFSNPSPELIRERLFPFIERIQKEHSGKPIVFLKTIYRHKRNFDMKEDKQEKRKAEVADSLMAIAVKKYNDVYYIAPNASATDFSTSVDGVHPDNYGYALWAESIRKPLLKILRKYGIR